MKNSSNATTMPAPTSEASCDFAPACSTTAVREPLVDTAKPWEQARREVGRPDADHLLVGIDLLAPAGTEARGGGDGVGEPRRA